MEQNANNVKTEQNEKFFDYDRDIQELCDAIDFLETPEERRKFVDAFINSKGRS